MHRFLSLLIILILYACNENNLDKNSGSKLMGNGEASQVQICNKEAETIYILMVTEYEKYNTVRYWKAVPSGGCIIFNEWANIADHDSSGYYFQSSRGRYTPKGSQYLPESPEKVCLLKSISLDQMDGSYNFDGKQAINSGRCPANYLRYSLAGLGTFQGDFPNVTYTFQGGSFLESERILSATSNKESTENLNKKISDLNAELLTLKASVEDCAQKSQILLTQGKILGTSVARIEELKSACKFSDTEHSELKKKFEETKNLAREKLNTLVAYLNDFYKELEIMGNRVGVIDPFQDDFIDAGVENLIRPKVDADLVSEPAEFFSKLGVSYKKPLANYYGQNTNKFVATGLAFTSTFASFGVDLGKTEELDQDAFLDFQKSVEEIESYFSTLDYSKDEYGYRLESPVPNDIKQIVRDDIRPYTGSSGVALEDELKKWEGNLTEKQKFILEAVRFLGIGFHQAILNAPNELETINKQIKDKLSSITEGAVSAIKETATCAAKIGASGDFADWYEIINKRDFCTGEEISRTGQVISAAGLIVGSAKFWRLMGDAVGFAVNTKRVFHETEVVIDSAKKVPGLGADAADLKKFAEVSSKYGRSAEQVSDSLKSGKGLFGNAQQISREVLNEGQIKNLKRFDEKLPSGSNPSTVHTEGTNVVFNAEVPGRVPGSKAVYEKVVDNSGTTISYTKTTYTPEGKIVHIKDKIDGSEIIPE
ncbi:MAG: hypothetical protein NTX25_24145 [Proteobacteria bacterium]|nr:hypothetical protein [Pseudomonadota bacterium]